MRCKLVDFQDEKIEYRDCLKAYKGGNGELNFRWRPEVGVLGWDDELDLTSSVYNQVKLIWDTIF